MRPHPRHTSHEPTATVCLFVASDEREIGRTRGRTRAL